MRRGSRSAASVTAGANGAHVIAVDIELANPAAAAIAIIVGLMGGDGAADNRGADDAGSDAPAQAGTAAAGICLGGGGSEAAGDGEGGEGESGNFRLDRHGKLHPV